MNWIIIILFNALAVYLGAKYLEGIKVEDFTRAVIVAIVVSILNATLGWILGIIFSPITWLTLGLFSWVINGLVLMVAAYFLKSFTIKNIWWAILLAFLISISNTIAHKLLAIG